MLLSSFAGDTLCWISCTHTIPKTCRGRLSHFWEEECLFCLIQAVDVDCDDPLLSDEDDGFQFECLLKIDGEASSEIPFQIDLPQQFVDEHATELLGGCGLYAVCVRGGALSQLNEGAEGSIRAFRLLQDRPCRGDRI